MLTKPLSSVNEPLLSARKITKRFGTFTALNQVDVDLNRGEVSVLVGSSGSGKSTLVRCVNLLEPINSGEISFNGELLGVEHTKLGPTRLPSKHVRRQRRYFGMVFQSFNLFPHMTALQNIKAGPKYVLRQPDRTLTERALALLERVGLSDKADQYPGQLSGGQQQRIAIARALAMEPEVLLFDEPTSALDPELVDEVFDVIRDLAMGGTTMMIVTHEMRFARNIADTLIYMDKGEILERGRPEEVINNPTTERAKTFFSRVQ